MLLYNNLDPMSKQKTISFLNNFFVTMDAQGRFFLNEGQNGLEILDNVQYPPTLEQKQRLENLMHFLSKEGIITGYRFPAGFYISNINLQILVPLTFDLIAAFSIAPISGPAYTPAPAYSQPVSSFAYTPAPTYSQPASSFAYAPPPAYSQSASCFAYTPAPTYSQPASSFAYTPAPAYSQSASGPSYSAPAYSQPVNNPYPTPSAPPYHPIPDRQSEPVISHYINTSLELQQKLHACLAVMLLLMGAEKKITLGKTPEGDLIIRARGGNNAPTPAQWKKLKTVVRLLATQGVEHEETYVIAETIGNEQRRTSGIRIFNINANLKFQLDNPKVIDTLVKFACPNTEAEANAQGWREYNSQINGYTNNRRKIDNTYFTPPSHLIPIVAALNTSVAAPLSDSRLQDALYAQSMQFKEFETYSVTNAAAPSHSPITPAPVSATPDPEPSAPPMYPRAKSLVGANPHLLLAAPALVNRHIKLKTKIPFAKLEKTNRDRLISYEPRIQAYWDKFSPALQAHILACVNLNLPNRLAVAIADQSNRLDNASVRCGINFEAAQIPVRFPNALNIKETDEKGQIKEGEIYELKVILDDYEKQLVHAGQERKLRDPQDRNTNLEFDQLLPAPQAKAKLNERAPNPKPLNPTR